MYAWQIENNEGSETPITQGLTDATWRCTRDNKDDWFKTLMNDTNWAVPIVVAVQNKNHPVGVPDSVQGITLESSTQTSDNDKYGSLYCRKNVTCLNSLELSK